MPHGGSNLPPLLGLHQQRYHQMLWAQVLPSVSGKIGRKCESDQIRKAENFIIYILNWFCSRIPRHGGITQKSTDIKGFMKKVKHLCVVTRERRHITRYTSDPHNVKDTGYPSDPDLHHLIWDSLYKLPPQIENGPSRMLHLRGVYL